MYGEGYQIDEAGNVISRFEVTQHFNLWKLLNVSDYILQQTVFFRRSIFDEIGWVDETLHYGMDWELLMRIGLRYPVIYVPHYMGAIREYPDRQELRGRREARARAREHHAQPHAQALSARDVRVRHAVVRRGREPLGRRASCADRSRRSARACSGASPRWATASSARSCAARRAGTATAGRRRARSSRSARAPGAIS